MAELLTLADIVGVYGIKGWVKLKIYLEDPQTLTQINGLLMAPGVRMRAGASKPIKIDALRLQGKSWVAHIAGLDDRTEAEALRGCALQADAGQLPAAADDEIYWRDLTGLKVWCRDGDTTALLGEVSYMLDTGSNDVMVTKACEGSLDDRERLIPWVPGEVIQRVDVAAAEVWVDWYVDA